MYPHELYSQFQFQKAKVVGKLQGRHANENIWKPEVETSGKECRSAFEEKELPPIATRQQKKEKEHTNGVFPIAPTNPLTVLVVNPLVNDLELVRTRLADIIEQRL